MQVDARVNAMLDAEFATSDKMSLHSAFSLTGANEITGGSYARQTITWASAASRSKASSGNIDFSTPAGASIAFIGVWDSAGTTFRGMWPNAGTERSYQVDLTTDAFLCEGHGMANGDRVVFTGVTVPTGLTAGTVYHVIGVTAGDPDTLQVSTTAGGSAVAISGQPSADSRISKVVVEVYGSAGTHRVSSFSVSM